MSFAYYNVQTQVWKTHWNNTGFMHANTNFTHDK